MSELSTDPRYPIGKYQPQPYSESLLQQWLDDLRHLPADLENAVQHLDEAQYDTPYREGGWTIRQVVHHLADSHMNAFIRFKLALTEDEPTIKPYDEKRWAETTDAKDLPANLSLTLLHALHRRWYEMVRGLDKANWERTYFHPGQKKINTLWNTLGLYAWHGKHHVAHIAGAPLG